jgi:hypothetical protein
MYSATFPAYVNRNEGAAYQAAAIFLIENWDNYTLGAEIPPFSNVRVTSVGTGFFCSIVPMNFTESPTGQAKTMMCGEADRNYVDYLTYVGDGFLTLGQAERLLITGPGLALIVNPHHPEYPYPANAGMFSFVPAPASE